MAAFEQHRSSEQSLHSSSQACGLQREVNNIWALPPMFKQAQDFASGMADGVGALCQESAGAVVHAVTKPGETINDAVKGATDTVKAGCETAVAAANYVGDKVSHGDLNGVVKDAAKAADTAGQIAKAGVDKASHMSAHDLGKVVGHDVLPNLVITVAAPELAGESVAMAANAMSKLGTLVKEEGALAKIGSVYESASSKIHAINEKMSKLNDKMDDLLKSDRYAPKRVEIPKAPGEGDYGGFEKPHYHSEEARKESFEQFKSKFEQTKSESLTKSEIDRLENHQPRPIETVPVHTMVDKFGPDFARTPGLYDPRENKIYVAQHVFHNGAWQLNNDVEFQLSHEIGHAFNATAKYDWMSELDSKFASTCKAELKTLSDDVKKSLLLNSKSERNQLDEIFADLYAHAKGIATNNSSYSGRFKELFPNTLKHMIEKDYAGVNK